jgi:hypothetical protein
MAYQINKTDGSIVSTVADGQVDQLSTDLTLIGKNYSGFGEALNENFIKLLENFSGTTRPSKPIRGQVWFDSSELKLKVYSGSEFLPVSSATISSTQPSSLGVGDLWFNDIDRQLYFFDGTNTILLGPAYSTSQGVSGLRVISLLDTLNQTRVITGLYNNGILLGIFAKDNFTPKNAIDGFSGSIIPGFNAGNLSGIKFNVTCTNSEQLGGTVATTYVRKDTSNAIAGQLRITTDLGLVVGSAGQANLTVSSGDVLLSNAASDKNIVFNVRRGIAQETAFEIRAATRVVQFYEGLPSSIVEFGGDVEITGNLTVQGTTTTINTANISVEDKSITLARSTGITPTDANASTGGIILQGASSHVFLWSELGQALTASSGAALSEGYNDGLPALASQAWTSSEHINLASGKEFKINGVTVISGTSLGAGITSIPGVTSFGAQTSLTVDNIFVDGSTIQVTASNTDLTLAINGTGTLNLGNKKITNVADPTAAQHAATKEYTDNTLETRPVILSIDLSDGKPNSYIINNILNGPSTPGGIGVAPDPNTATARSETAYYRSGTIAKILCNIIVNGSTSLDINPLISQSTSTFTTPTGTAPAVTNVAISSATVSAASISTTRIIKTFQIVAGAWTHVSDTLLPP